MTTHAGTIEPEVSRVRDGKCSTETTKRYQHSEQALTPTMTQMVVNGISTRTVKKVINEMCGCEFSKSTVTELCKLLGPMLEERNQRDRSDRSLPYVNVDGLDLRIRENNRVRQKSALMDDKIHHNGYRDILGLKMSQ